MTPSQMYDLYNNMVTDIFESPFIRDFQKISENYYLVNQMSIPENKDFFKTLFQMDIDIEKSISETIELNSPILPNYFFVKFNIQEEETQFLLSFKNYKDKSKE